MACPNHLISALRVLLASVVTCVESLYRQFTTSLLKASKKDFYIDLHRIHFKTITGTSTKKLLFILKIMYSFCVN